MKPLGSLLTTLCRIFPVPRSAPPAPEPTATPLAPPTPIETAPQKSRRPRLRRERQPAAETVVELPNRFGDLPVSPPIARALRDLGYERPTPIQAEVIPLLLEGVDVVGQAQTGTGKTTAFGLPLAEKLDPKLREVQAVVLVPTRELCMQVAEELSALSKYRGLRVVTVVGGKPLKPQITALAQGAHIVVGTPGRVLDLMGRGALRLNAVKVAVLDEADEMLDIGFAQDMEDILRRTPKTRQTALFSATVPPFIRKLIHRYLHEPATVHVNPESVTVPEIDQIYYEIAESEKLDALIALFETRQPDWRVLIFRRTQRGVDALAEALIADGWPVRGLHGGLSQSERDYVMRGFRDGSLPVVISTNVAARGIDIPEITHVIQYDLPDNAEEYVHRIGRTARAGRRGTAILFVSEWDLGVLEALQEHMGGALRQGTPPWPEVEPPSEAAS